MNKRVEFLLVSLGLLGTYSLFFMLLDLPVSAEFMYSTTDSRTYLEVANWIGGIAETRCTNIRPVGFPFIIWCTSFFGATGLWLTQVVFWVAGGNFLYAAIRNYSASRIAAGIGAVLYAINLSSIGSTLHAITETTTILLLTILLWHFSRSQNRFSDAGFLAGVLLLLGLLTIVKPLFYPIFLATSVVTVFIMFRIRPKLTGIILLIGATTPVLTQLTIMKLKHNAFTISTIGKVTVQQYLLTYTYAELNGIEYYQAKPVMWNYTKEEADNFVTAHYVDIFHVFREKIKENVAAHSVFVSNPVNKEREPWSGYMKRMNSVYCQFHTLFLVVIPAFMLLVYRRSRNQRLVPALFAVLLSLYIILTSGISGYQGDRLVLPALPLWIFAYSAVAVRAISMMSPGFSKTIVQQAGMISRRVFKRKTEKREAELVQD